MKELWDNYKANVGLVLLIVYTLSLGVATADEVFGLGLFKTKLEKMINVAVDKFDSEVKSEREAAARELIEYGDFAVPQLVSALGGEGPARELAIYCLQQITDEKYSDPGEWEQWYQQHGDQY